MDFDGDGKLDLVSGSYDPGELYLFRGLGGGKFASREMIRDRSGKPILKVRDQTDRMDSFGSWMTVVDWDDDGDLDILVGTLDGMMFVRRNEGTRTRPVYATQNEWVMVGSKRLRVPGRKHANPVIADWDGDGLWDIISGSADGGVYWYRNMGKRGQPRFAQPVVLIPTHEGPGTSELLDVQEQPHPGIRSQIAVVDYDGDGKLDILLGDFCTNLHVRKDLTPQERRAFGAARDRQSRVAEAMRQSGDALQECWNKLIKALPKSANRTRQQKLMDDMRHTPAMTKLATEYERCILDYEKANEELKRYTDAASAPQARAPTHGYVWLFRRK